MHWYDRILPTIEEATPYVEQVAKEISLMPCVKAVYAWGSFAENIGNKKFNVKDIDLLVKCRFESGDLLAIDQGPNGPLGLSVEDLEMEGFNADAVAFTRKYLKYSQYNIDQWVLSKDKKILHWGPITETVSEWKELRDNAEEYAKQQTGFTRKKLCQASDANRKDWLKYYSQFMQDFIAGGPIGWYASETPVEEVINQFVKLA